VLMDYRVRAITTGPRHHFFGYYDMRPWDPTGRYHLVLEVDFADRPPGPDDEAVVGVVDLADGETFIPLARTRAWNFQQGAMLHWLGGPDRTVVFNDRREGRFVCVAHATASGRERIVGPAIAALSDDGRLAATLNFARIAVTRPGYGYEGLADPGEDQSVPADDGLGILDFATGRHRLIVRFPDLAARQEQALGYGRQKVWFNHACFNPSGDRLAFLCRWVPAGRRPWVTQMWTVGVGGQELLRVLPGPMVSHFDWKDDRTILAWAEVDGVASCWQIDARGQRRRERVFAEVIRRDGHICYSHDRRWLLTDTYPDSLGMRKLLLVSSATGRPVSLGSYYSPAPPLPEIRRDLHPSWRDDDRQIAFDGMHEGTRRRYVLELEP